jgi:hypothetical protein
MVVRDAMFLGAVAENFLDYGGGFVVPGIAGAQRLHRISVTLLN